MATETRSPGALLLENAKRRLALVEKTVITIEAQVQRIAADDPTRPALLQILEERTLKRDAAARALADLEKMAPWQREQLAEKK